MGEIDRHRFIFIGGLHRSATSLLHRLIGSHPQVSFFQNTGAPQDEGQWLQSVYPPARVYGGPGLFAFAPEAHLTEHSPLATEENGRKLFAEWSKHWDVSKPYLVEKSPPNLIRARFLQKLFPHSRVVFVMRHPAAVSLATHKWTPDVPVARLLEHWNEAHRIMLEDVAALENVFVMRYEDLIAAPEETLATLWDFLKLDPIPLTEVLSSGVNTEYFARWHALLESHPALRGRLASLEALPARFGYRFELPYFD